MNQMWSEMSEFQREEYKDYFISYHNGVAKTGVTGKIIKPLTVLPDSVIAGFDKAIMTRVRKLHFSFIFHQNILVDVAEGSRDRTLRVGGENSEL